MSMQHYSKHDDWSLADLAGGQFPRYPVKRCSQLSACARIIPTMGPPLSMSVAVTLWWQHINREERVLACYILLPRLFTPTACLKNFLFNALKA